MLVIRNVFHCKPGKAKDLVKLMKETMASGSSNMPKGRVLTDLSAGFWTVILEHESDSLEAWEKMFSGPPEKGGRRPMEGYMDLVTGGYREIFKIE